jgi:hypothetical protein
MRRSMLCLALLALPLAAGEENFNIHLWEPGKVPLAADPVDRLDSKPNFLRLVYGPGRASATEKLKEFPPTFLLSDARTSARSAAWPSFQAFRMVGFRAAREQ